MKLLESVDRVIINDANKFYLEETETKYKNYIKELLLMDKKLLKHYLLTLKNTEILYNQESEEESSLLISLYMNLSKVNSIDKMIEIMKKQKDITIQNIINLHSILMEGTLNSEISDGFRNNNNKFVGSFYNNGEKRIDYIPIDYKEIKNVMDKITTLINRKNVNNPFILPFIIHALISVAQPFDDGNTRLSRLIQHGKIWKSTEVYYNTKFDSPILYLSKNYKLTRGQYRELIKELAIKEGNESWNKWFKYNLNMVNEQLYYLNNNIKKLVKKS